ncbi:MAG TPA: HAD domain-containing protein [Flavobacterium sp.]|nr:HAD domain-containing protein [Flavobacterium sp.]
MLILLDIDGVMVPANSWKSPDLLNDGFPGFSKNATLALRKIISETGAQIMLTTSHKSIFSLQKWREIFQSRGLELKEIKKLPDNTTHLSRKDEVLNWFATNKVQDSFVIIDDDKSLNALPVYLKDKLILTSGAIGLNNAHAEEAITLLKSETNSVPGKGFQ